MHSQTSSPLPSLSRSKLSSVRRRGLQALTVATLALACLAASAAGPWRESRQNSQNGLGGEGMLTLNFQGEPRSFLLRLPGSLPRDGARLPLVIALHGGGGHAANMEEMTGFTAKARQEGFIVVYPEGSGRLRHSFLTWNAGHCCGQAMEKREDDAGFIRALIEHLEANYPVDPMRIYATGMSNGGMMTHRLGSELGDRLAAIAPVVATVFGDERRPQHGVPALMINGGLDQSVPPAGGPPGGAFPGAWDGTPTLPALAQLSFWAGANGCVGEAQTSVQGVLSRWRHSCPAGHSAELLLVGDNGHAWPGGRAGSRRGDTPSSAVNATDEIWAFFRRHSK